MCSCWESKQELRPTFSVLVHKLELVLEICADYCDLTGLRADNCNEKATNNENITEYDDKSTLVPASLQNPLHSTPNEYSIAGV